jgi:hypothetical protein
MIDVAVGEKRRKAVDVMRAQRCREALGHRLRRCSRLRERRFDEASRKKEACRRHLPAILHGISPRSS